MAFRNALPLDSGIDFHSHTDRLITGIRELVDVGEIQREHSVRAAKIGSEIGASPAAPSGPARRSGIPVWGAVGMVTAIGIALFWWLLAGKHRDVMDTIKRSAATTPSPPFKTNSVVESRPSPESVKTDIPSTVKSPSPEVSNTFKPEASPAQTSSPTASEVAKIFVGTWEGQVTSYTTDNRGKYGPNLLQLIIDERGGVAAVQYHDGKPIVSREEALKNKQMWLQAGSRTLTSDPRKHFYSHSSITISEDRRSAEFVDTPSNGQGFITRGTMYKSN